MKKFGKYEKMRKNAILQTYITSLLCLILCVTMFFGTSMAWFSDTAESTYNEMYVGTLEIDLNHASFKNGSLGSYAKVDDDYKVFDTIENGGIRWEPGYTAVEKFELTEKGDLAFSYQLGVECEFVDTLAADGTTIQTSAAAKKEIAKAITVWNYVGENADSITQLPANFADLTAVDAEGKSDWENIGTLHDVISGEKVVFSGEMDKTAVNKDEDAKAYHMIALHMDEIFDGFVKDDNGNPTTDTVKGDTLDGITIKLVATQKSSEEDAFGYAYDASFVEVKTVEELTEAVAAGKNPKLVENIDMNGKRVDIPADKAVVIDLNGHTLTSKDGGQDNWMAIYVNEGAKLTLNDTAGNGKIVSSCYGVYVKTGATFVMNGGTLTVSGNGTYDMGVVLWNAEFIMNGGTIDAKIGVCASNYYKLSDSTLPVNRITLGKDAIINASTEEINLCEGESDAAPDTVIVDNRTTNP